MAKAPSPAARVATNGAQPSLAAAAGSAPENELIERDKTLPLPGWLTKVYFIFPIVLYIPDAIFNYFVYSDGLKIPPGNIVLQVAQITLWGFMSIGVVGMAYLLSVLAPWHWGQGHRVQALFCALGVVIATAITTWNSLAFRSTGFQAFKTDEWASQVFPQLSQLSGFSLTMILVAIAPPFWGLFWAVVQPTQTGRSLRQLQETHAERLLRMQQEAELKRLKAESNAKVRTAQLRGMAETAAAAREQAVGLFGRKPGDGVVDGTIVTEEPSDGDDGGADSSGELPAVQGSGRVLQLPSAKPGLPARGETVLYNHAAAATPTVRSAPAGTGRAAASQPSLLSDADVGQVQTQATGAGDPSPWPARRPPVPGGGILGSIFNDDDQLTGTTGPRPVVKRPGENSPLFRDISEDMSSKADAAVQAVYEEIKREFSADGARRSLPKKELVARFMRQHHVDEATAQKAVDHWYRTQKNKRG
jgi:hypothetical protein